MPPLSLSFFYSVFLLSVSVGHPPTPRRRLHENEKNRFRLFLPPFGAHSGGHGGRNVPPFASPPLFRCRFFPKIASTINPSCTKSPSPRGENPPSLSSPTSARAQNEKLFAFLFHSHQRRVRSFAPNRKKARVICAFSLFFLWRPLFPNTASSINPLFTITLPKEKTIAPLPATDGRPQNEKLFAFLFFLVPPIGAALFARCRQKKTQKTPPSPHPRLPFDVDYVAFSPPSHPFPNKQSTINPSCTTNRPPPRRQKSRSPFRRRRQRRTRGRRTTAAARANPSKKTALDPFSFPRPTVLRTAAKENAHPPFFFFPFRCFPTPP